MSGGRTLGGDILSYDTVIQERPPEHHTTTKWKHLPRSAPLYALREAFPANEEVATNHAGWLTVRIIGDVYVISVVYVNSYYQLLATRNILSAKRIND